MTFVREGSSASRRPLLYRSRVAHRSDAIDSLRALLALWVVATHLAEWGPLTATGSSPVIAWIERNTTRVFQSHGETHPAVLAFIVLSGYCIHRNGARREGWSARTYAIKRLFRIVPVYVLATLFGAALFTVARDYNGHVAESISATARIHPGCLAAKLLGIPAVVPDIHLYTCTFQGNAPLATVMVEIWLYVVYGLMVWLLLARISDRGLWAIVTVAWLGGLVFVDQSPAHLNWWYNGSLVSYLPFWWIGATLVGEVSRRTAVAFAIAAAAAWAGLTAALWDSNAWVVPDEIRMLAYGVLVGFAIRGLDLYARHLPRPATFVGRAGYSLYAFHAPILIALVALGAAWWMILVVAVAFAVAMFLVYENPLTQYGRRRARAVRQVPAPVAAAAQSAADI